MVTWMPGEKTSFKEEDAGYKSCKMRTGSSLRCGGHWWVKPEWSGSEGEWRRELGGSVYGQVLSFAVKRKKEMGS